MRFASARLAGLARLARTFSLPGLLLGTIFFAFSLTPSLLPRDYALQGVLSGCSLAAGYGVGVFLHGLWHYLELPDLPDRADRIVKILAALACAATALLFLRQASEWQNSIRHLMGMAPVDTARPIEVGLIAFGVFIVIVVFARLFRVTMNQLSRRLKRFIPPRVAYVVGTLVAVALFWSAIDGVLFRVGLRMADASFQQLDALVEDDVERPAAALKTGSQASLVDWEDLGRQGRRFIHSGPTREDIEAFSGPGAMEPIRIFVGLNSAETPELRARLAFEEMLRVGAFERSVVVIVTPTGTGWVDPAAMDTLEHLHRGDVASVALQYSYLSSWLSLLFEPGYGAEAARALFRYVYDHWSGLPAETRPRLYLHGLSLGAYNSDRSTDLYDIIADPFHGAVWSGPPFSSETWRSVTDMRDPASPFWLPRFRDGSVIRFTNQHNALTGNYGAWGPMRIVFLQYASDPVTFFDPGSAYREPPWMTGPRAPDVSPELRWFPIVTFLQLLLDMMLATTTPTGYGHVYAPEHYIDAWMEVTEPAGWPASELERLKAHYAGLRRP